MGLSVTASVKLAPVREAPGALQEMGGAKPRRPRQASVPGRDTLSVPSERGCRGTGCCPRHREAMWTIHIRVFRSRIRRPRAAGREGLSFCHPVTLSWWPAVQKKVQKWRRLGMTEHRRLSSPRNSRKSERCDEFRPKWHDRTPSSCHGVRRARKPMKMIAKSAPQVAHDKMTE